MDREMFDNLLNAEECRQYAKADDFWPPFSTKNQVYREAVHATISALRAYATALTPQSVKEGSTNG